jgi:hypothetical protein
MCDGRPLVGVGGERNRMMAWRLVLSIHFSKPNVLSEMECCGNNPVAEPSVEMSAELEFAAEIETVECQRGFEWMGLFGEKGGQVFDP